MVYQETKGTWAFRHHCGAFEGGFKTKNQARVAFELHLIGCNK